MKLKRLKMQFDPESFRIAASRCRELSELDLSVAVNYPPVGVNGEKGPKLSALRCLHVTRGYPDMVDWLIDPNCAALEEVAIQFLATGRCTTYQTTAWRQLRGDIMVRFYLRCFR